MQVKRLFRAFAAIVLSVPVAAQSSPFALDPLADGISVGFGAAYAAASEFVDLGLHAVPSDPESVPVNPVDSFALFPYSAGLDVASDLLQYVSFFAPAVLAFAVPDSEWLCVGTMYFEAASVSFGTKNWVKQLAPRLRPYTRFPGAPEDSIASGDFERSFPSGHTTLAFTGAAFLAYVFAAYYPDSEWSLPVSLGAFALAGGTATLRVLSGSHHISDVAVGAAIGTASGILVPLLHASGAGKGGGVSVVPSGLNFTIKY